MKKVFQLLAVLLMIPVCLSAAVLVTLLMWPFFCVMAYLTNSIMLPRSAMLKDLLSIAFAPIMEIWKAYVSEKENAGL